MSPWHSGILELGDVKIFYTRTGNGDKAPVVLAHGFADNGRCWTRAAQALEESYDVVMYDARGHGRSSAPDEGYTSEARVVDLAGLIACLGLRRPALIGHSMGAATVAMFAASHPHTARSIVLEDPPWGPPTPPPSPEQVQASLAVARARLLSNKSRSREELIARARSRHPTWPANELGPYAEAKRELSLNILNILSAPSIPWQDVVTRIRCPILVLRGDAAAGSIVTEEVAAEMAGLWRTGRIVHIHGAGHNIRREQFDAFIQAITDFLEEGGGSTVL